MKKICLLVAGALALIMMAGCAQEESAVVVTVNGVSITQEQWDTLTRGYLGDSPDNILDYMSEEEAVAFKDSVLDVLVMQQLVLQKADELGITLTDEEVAQAEEAAQSYLESLKSYYDAQSETGDGTEAYVANMDAYGITADSLRQENLDAAVIEKVYAHFTDSIAPTEEDVRAYYDELVAGQQAAYESDPDGALYNYLNGMNMIDVYVPDNAAEEVRMVKHVLVKIPDETAGGISSLRMAGDDAGADALLAEALAEIEPQAQAVLEKAQAGEDFDALIEAYGEDEGMAYYPEGYQVYEGANFVESFLQASMAIDQVGGISGLTPSDYGYHIIKYVSSPAVGAVPFEEVQATLLELKTQADKEETWDALLAQWEQEAEIVYAAE